MNKLINKKWMNGQINEWMNKKNEWTNEWIDK